MEVDFQKLVTTQMMALFTNFEPSLVDVLCSDLVPIPALGFRVLTIFGVDSQMLKTLFFTPFQCVWWKCIRNHDAFSEITITSIKISFRVHAAPENWSIIQQFVQKNLIFSSIFGMMFGLLFVIFQRFHDQVPKYIGKLSLQMFAVILVASLILGYSLFVGTFQSKFEYNEAHPSITFLPVKTT